MFLIGYTVPSSETAKPTDFYLVSRQKGTSSFTFQKTPDICPPFGMDRSPSHYFVQRLRYFPPNLDDVLIFASTSAADTSVFSKSKVPLSSDLDASEVTNVLTMTTIIDSKRANMPMDAAMSDTSPIGMVIDLSSREKVKRPLPGEEMDESPGPLPALLILNNEGVLCAWWFVYADSIRQGTTYPEMLVQQSQGPNAANPSAVVPASSTATFGQPSLGSPSKIAESASPFAKSAPSTTLPFSGLFGSPQSTSGSQPSFGSGSSFGNKSSPWASGTTGPSTAQNAAFGSTSTLGGPAQSTTFGTSGGLGNKGSVWGTPASAQGQGSGSVVGQSSGLGMRTGQPPASNSSPFTSGTKPGGAGFSSFASSGGFLSGAGNRSESVLKPGSGGLFGDNTGSTSFSGLADTPKESDAGLFSGETFKLGSTFTSDGTAKDDLPKPKNISADAFFGGSLGETLNDAQKIEKPVDREEEMNEESDHRADESSEDEPPKSPATTPSRSNDLKPLHSSTPFNGGMFGTTAQNETTPAAVHTNTPAKAPPASTTPEDTPHKQNKTPSESPSASGDSSPLTPIKDELEYETSDTPPDKTPQAPLPPESTSKTSYAAGESSNSSKASSDDAPLPPDFMPLKNKLSTDMQPPEKAALPSDGEDEGLDGEGSGVDVAQDLSPSESNQTPGITPGSTFTGSLERTPLGEKFVNVRHQEPRLKASTLFGELSESTTPSLPPPTKPRTILSPRSPSPTRQENLQTRILNNENIRPASLRSFTTPARPTEMLAPRRPPKLPQPVKEQEPAEETEEEAEVSDEEDEKVRKRLESEIVPSRTLPELEVHKDYVGKITKPGIPGQIDRVERDISSMIDVLGLNARSLKCWTASQEEESLPDNATMEGLTSMDPAKATMNDLYPISDILADLSIELSESRLQDPLSVMQFTYSTSYTLLQFLNQRQSLQRAIDSRSDPQAIASWRSAPLSQEQSALLRDLRSRVTAYQSRLAKAEAEIVNLRAQLATSNGVIPAGGKRPTVEAVMKTIRKMTAMVERRSGDVDVLEYRLRKLGFNPDVSVPQALDNGQAKSLGNEREGTPTTALQQGLQSMSLDLGSSKQRKAAKTVFTEEEIETFKQQRRRRKEIYGVVADVLTKSGPRQTGLES